METSRVWMVGLASLGLVSISQAQVMSGVDAVAKEPVGNIVYKADSTHADIGFAVKHLVISKVRGHFKEFDATLQLDENNNLVEAEATIEVGSIDTANEERDKHLRSVEFFDAESHPQITFKSTGIEHRNGRDVIVGDFTIRGTTKEIALPYTLSGPVQDPWGNTKVGFHTEITIDRTEYGLTWNAALEAGGVVVGENVEISVDLEFAKQ